jgi:hypothetical protein
VCHLYTCVLCSAVLVPLYCFVRLDVVTTSQRAGNAWRTVRSIACNNRTIIALYGIIHKHDILNRDTSVE